jgi:hypothetical protein
MPELVLSYVAILNVLYLLVTEVAIIPPAILSVNHYNLYPLYPSTMSSTRLERVIPT